MPNVYYDNDADLSLLQDKTIGIIGYGSQGHAHALNLNDSGLNVLVGLHSDSTSREKARSAGLEVADVAEVADRSQIIMVLIPDHLQGAIYKEQIEPYLEPGNTLMFAHGFSIHYRQVLPPVHVNVSMIAPKAPGHRMREVYVEGNGVPALLAIQQDATGLAKDITLAYAKGVGSTRAGVLETTFKDETETDLFGEQSVLCGGITSLIKTAFETLVEAGYSPELAYFECLHEVKLIVDLIYQGGFEYMRYSVSDTAEYGDLTRGPSVIDEHVRGNMRQVLAAIQDGSFAREWIAENDEGRKRFSQLRKDAKFHQIEDVGKELRGMMQWLDPK
jgi:ketol-acid reductoisomerase